MSAGIVAVIDSINVTQNAEFGDHEADAIVTLSTGAVLRGQVEERDGVVVIYQRLRSPHNGYDSRPAGSDEMLNDSTDHGASEIPVHVALAHVVSVSIFGAGR